MAIRASGRGGILVRADPAETDTLVSTTSATVMEMRGRQMPGHPRVDAEDVRDEAELARWVDVGAGYRARCRRSA